MIQELLARAAEDLTVALNNFETARKELTDDELAAFKEVCRKAKEAVQEALEAAKGALDTKTAETIRQIEMLLAQSTQAIERKITEAKQDVDTKVQQGLTSITDKVQQADTDITGKVDKAKKDVAAQVQQGLTSIDEKVAQGISAIGTKEQEAKNTLNNKVTHVQQLITTVTDAQNALNKKTNEAKHYIDTQLSAASSGIDTKIRSSIQTHMTGEEAKLLEKVNQKFIQFFTNIYIVQFPGMPTPDMLFTFEGYRWAEVNYNGCFFRAKGSNALSFNGGEQGDAMRNIKGDIARTMPYDVSPSWPFYQQSASSDLVTSLTVAYFGSYQMLSFDAGFVVPTAEENRPRNRTFIIWRLEKI